MDNKFQDRIDEYLLHADSMTDEARAQFEKEIEEDAEKKAQYEFTKNVKDALTSRGEKLKAMADFQREYEEKASRQSAAAPCMCEAAPGYNSSKPRPARRPAKRGKWLWFTGIAAMLAVGIFIFQDTHKSDNGNIRGGEDTFGYPTGIDSLTADTCTADTCVTDTLTADTCATSALPSANE